ncbi:Nucleotidyl transferase AbiEii toxin, Type IV TA system [uncultured archaeon]|nr:Nucleotidyl transferase AbiEii toxin, Type IV TA system [uncultured archaeon]
MREAFEKKYRRVLEILPDIAQATEDKLVLVGGTALAVFYLQHRTSVDIDFVPIKDRDDKMKEMLKGALSSKGYRTQRSAYANQFVVQFDDTAIKIEVFEPEYKIRKIERHEIRGHKLQVASVEDIFRMKKLAYKDRHASRDLFDLYCMARRDGNGNEIVWQMIRKFGKPERLDEFQHMVLKPQDYDEFVKVIGSCSPTK